MPPSSSCTSEYDEETRALEPLLDAFGSFCTLEEIASAYCKSRRDVIKAGEILYQIQESKSHGASHAQNGKQDLQTLEESYYESNIKHSDIQYDNSKSSKPRKLSASSGTVSSVLGNKYVRVSSSRNESHETTKPLKLGITEPTVYELDAEPGLADSVPRADSRADKDIEEFLYSMLGDGFKLNKDVIRDVLGHCRYDISQSMDELLTISARTLSKGKTVQNDGVGKPTDSYSKLDPCLYTESYSNSSTERYNARQSSTDKSTLPKEVLLSLFTVPERSEKEPEGKRLALGLNRTRVVGQKVVTKPLDDNVFSFVTDIPKIRHDVDSVVDEEDDYKVLRRAVKQHWDAMKIYFQYAIDAYTRGDSERANYFMQQGHYYNQKAREADIKSNEEIVEPKKTDKKDEISLNIQAQPAKVALDLLKLHLHKLADIPSYKYLKVIMGTDGEDRKKEKKRRQIIKLLDKESIMWTEDYNDPGTIFIRLDKVNPRKLSFAKAS